MRRWLVWLPLSALLIIFVLWRTRPWEAASLWERLEPLGLVAALLLNVPIVLLWAIRSKLLMERLGHPLPTSALVSVVAFANTINNVTPGSVGEALRAWILRRRHAVPYATSAAVIVVERFWAIGIMALSALAAATGPLLGWSWQQVILAWLIAAGLSLAPALLYLVGLRPGRLLDGLASRRGGRLGRLLRVLADVDELLLRLLTGARTAAGFVLTTAAIFFCYTLQLWAILAALRSPVGIEAAWAALGLATVAGVLSALPFGLGATDLVLAELLTAMGTAPASAGAAVLLYRATVTLPLGLAGSLSWIHLVGRRDPETVERELRSEGGQARARADLLPGESDVAVSGSGSRLGGRPG